MDIIQVIDKKFTVTIPEKEILERVDKVAQQINKDMAGKNPLFLAVLNGSFIFAADLMRRIIHHCSIEDEILTRAGYKVEDCMIQYVASDNQLTNNQ